MVRYHKLKYPQIYAPIASTCISVLTLQIRIITIVFRFLTLPLATLLQPFLANHLPHNP